MNEWITADWNDDKTLPPEGKEILACFYNGSKKQYIITARMDYNYFARVGRTGDCVAWMDIPDYEIGACIPSR